MIPVRDNLGDGGAPPAALLLVALITVAGFAVPGGSWLPALVAFAGAWVYVPTPVRDLGPAPVYLLAAAGGAAGGWLASLAGADPGDWAAPAAAGAVVALHLARYRGAAVICLVPIPYRATLSEISSPLIAALWAIIGATAIAFA